MAAAVIKENVMRKKEVRWLSRDRNGRHDLWAKKPHKARDAWWGAKGEPYRPGRNEAAYEFADKTGINLTCGGLAKITIERQY